MQYTVGEANLDSLSIMQAPAVAVFNKRANSPAISCHGRPTRPDSDLNKLHGAPVVLCIVLRESGLASPTVYIDPLLKMLE